MNAGQFAEWAFNQHHEWRQFVKRFSAISTENHANSIYNLLIQKNLSIKNGIFHSGTKIQLALYHFVNRCSMEIAFEMLTVCYILLAYKIIRVY